MVRKMLLGALALLALTAAPAAAQYRFVVGPGQVTVGGEVSVAGEGCSPGDEVTITMTPLNNGSTSRAAGNSVVVATTIADESGEFNTTYTVPEGTALGKYEVEAFCGGYSVGSSIIEVVAPSDGGSGNGSIVRTGSDLNGLGLLGAGLLTGGGIILLATKSRRNRATA
ncbi:MAG: hypothetical protein KDA97_11320 [Acidimicrobiales bacterium]|nr:hypothetical protein [Acidimicrobiales bacterium]